MSLPAHHLSPLLTQSSGIHAGHGTGCWLHDRNGQSYLDFTSGIGVLSTGHCHPHVVRAIKTQAERLIHAQYAIMRHSPLVELSDVLARLTPDGIDSFFFANAGTEAVEAAIRLARQATGRPNVIAFEGAFHGRSMGALSLTSSNAKVRQGVQPMMGGTVIAPFPDPHWYDMPAESASQFCLKQLDRILASRSTPAETAAMIVEPVQGESGYLQAPATFLQGLRGRCDRYGIPLIIDEIQCGNGRSGHFWAHEPTGITPDILVTAKGIASGLPLSVMGASRELMERGWPGSQGGTYGGNALACAAALATLEVIRHEDLVGNAAARGAELRDGLEARVRGASGLDHVRGIGLMQGVYVTDADGLADGQRARELVAAAERAGLLLLICGLDGNIIRWLPPLTVSSQELARALELFDIALAETRYGDSVTH